MLDLKYVLGHLDEVRAALGRRGTVPALDELVALDKDRRAAIAEAEKLKAERNESSKKIGELMKSGQDAAPLRERVRQVGDLVKELDAKVAEADERLKQILMSVPNVPHASIPTGADESANRVERVWGEKPSFGFAPKDHVALGEQNGILDFERAAKITGARFAVLTGMGARLERALINFMLDLHTTHHGYREVLPPFMVNRKSLTGTGQLPKFEQDLFKVPHEPEDWFLIPTAEVPVTNLHADEILEAKDLPLRYCAYTPCFRSEAGSYGKDVRGLIRQHQFDKVELVSFADPESSYDVLEQLTSHAEEVLKRLGLHYRVVSLSSGDIGFSSAKTYDLEVWLPSQDTFREISSCSNFEDFQARRAAIRFRGADGKVRFAHTLNGSGLAIGRTLVAILENFQREDGTIEIPAALRPYMESRV